MLKKFTVSSTKPSSENLKVLPTHSKSSASPVKAGVKASEYYSRNIRAQAMLSQQNIVQS